MHPNDVPLVATVLEYLCSAEMRAAQTAIDAGDLRSAHLHLKNLNNLSSEMQTLFGQSNNLLELQCSGPHPGLPPTSHTLDAELPARMPTLSNIPRRLLH